VANRKYITEQSKASGNLPISYRCKIDAVLDGGNFVFCDDKMIMTDKIIRTLAAKYDFSGGQIENIARHYAIDCILHGNPENALEMLSLHCNTERLEKKEHRK